MARVMELVVIVNGACGIAAFILAKGLWQKGKNKVMGEEKKKEIQ